MEDAGLRAFRWKPRGLRSRRGFTLIEVITVVVVIAILAGILIPVVNGLMESGRISKATAEFRTLKTAVQRIFTDIGVVPKEVAAGIDPGFKDKTKVPAIVADAWKGPYIEQFPRETPWNANWDYDHASFPFWNEDGRVNNEVAISHRARMGGPAGAIRESSAEELDRSLDSKLGAADGIIRWTLDPAYEVNWFGMQVFDADSW